MDNLVFNIMTMCQMTRAKQSKVGCFRVALYISATKVISDLAGIRITLEIWHDVLNVLFYDIHIT